VQKGCFGSQSFASINDEQLVDKVLCLFRDFIPVGRRILKVRLHDLLKDFRKAFAVEGRESAQTASQRVGDWVSRWRGKKERKKEVIYLQEISDNSNAPKIHSLIVSLSGQDFGSCKVACHTKSREGKRKKKRQGMKEGERRRRNWWSVFPLPT
jgi:hypothetical protein